MKKINEKNKIPEESVRPEVGLDVILGGEVLLGLNKSQATTHQHRDSLGEENINYLSTKGFS